MHAANRWTSNFLLRSLDGNRTDFAKRKAGRGIRLVTRNQLSVPARTIGNDTLPITAYQLARYL